MRYPFFAIATLAAAYDKAEMPSWVECSSCNMRPTKDALRAEFNIEIHVPTRYGGSSLSFDIDPGGDDDISAHFTIGKLFWLSGSIGGTGFTHRLVRRVMRQSERSNGLFDKYSGREMKLAWHDGALWWSFWCDPHAWSRRIPKWRNGAWHPADTVLGKTKVDHVVIHETATEIPLPEGSMPAAVTIERWVRKRPRWTSEIGYRATVKPERPVPVPGKGENSWDCDDDAIHEQTSGVHARTENRERVAQAVARFAESVLTTRARYGGKNWSPQPVED